MTIQKIPPRLFSVATEDLRWYQSLYDNLTNADEIPWDTIDKTGSDLADIETRPHSSLQSILGADDTSTDTTLNKHVSNNQMKLNTDHRAATSAHGATGNIVGRGDTASTLLAGVVLKAAAVTDAAASSVIVATADVSASSVSVSAGDVAGSSVSVTASDVSTTASTNAVPWGYATQAQADSIPVLVNECKADINTLISDYNAWITLINECKADINTLVSNYNVWVTLINELKSDVNTLVTDVNAIKTTLNLLLASERTAGQLAT